MPGPRSVDRDRPLPDAHDPIGSSPSASNLTAFSSRLPAARSSAAAAPADHRAVGRRCDGPTRAAPHPLGRALGHRGEVHGLLGLLAAAIEGEFDELVDQARELAGLALDVVEEALAGLRGELGDPAQHARVGAQARQRRPQFVSGVLDEPLLRLPGRGEPPEHRVERRREASDLVAPVHRHLVSRPPRSR